MLAELAAQAYLEQISAGVMPSRFRLTIRNLPYLMGCLTWTILAESGNLCLYKKKV
ncbi:MAG: hypothetical protein A4E72_02155 [Syntrophus sp. PtaU1.Bin208]|nr:MAG: hypothetical protein A4E72_02155 [Syntrophus sp. PtaU1.Bin208]